MFLGPEDMERAAQYGLGAIGLDSLYHLSDTPVRFAVLPGMLAKHTNIATRCRSLGDGTQSNALLPLQRGIELSCSHR